MLSAWNGRPRKVGRELQADNLLAAGQLHDTRKRIREALDAPEITHQFLAGLRLVPFRRPGKGGKLFGVERAAYTATPRLA
ncbi:hypothetical protein EJ067_33925 [Mesorhizobium sp. M1D.F.Ca.ET.043.01.1.1]|nr:hypothetical protein EJ067_33925 [Mesorhizobium sp. M1D.F.Ca.ET.043.01.1.1]